jgi:hypothetical protein
LFTEDLENRASGHHFDGYEAIVEQISITEIEEA